MHVPSGRTSCQLGPCLEDRTAPCGFSSCGAGGAGAGGPSCGQLIAERVQRPCGERAGLQQREWNGCICRERTWTRPSHAAQAFTPDMSRTQGRRTPAPSRTKPLCPGLGEALTGSGSGQKHTWERADWLIGPVKIKVLLLQRREASKNTTGLRRCFQIVYM